MGLDRAHQKEDDEFKVKQFDHRQLQQIIMKKGANAMGIQCGSIYKVPVIFARVPGDLLFFKICQPRVW